MEHVNEFKDLVLFTCHYNIKLLEFCLQFEIKCDLIISLHNEICITVEGDFTMIITSTVFVQPNPCNLRYLYILPEDELERSRFPSLQVLLDNAFHSLK